MSVPLTKVDSAIAGLSIEDNKPAVSEEKEAKKTHKRTSSQAENVWNILDLGIHNLSASSDSFLLTVVYRGTEDRARATHRNPKDWLVSFLRLVVFPEVIPLHLNHQDSLANRPWLGG